MFRENNRLGSPEFAFVIALANTATLYALLDFRAFFVDNAFMPTRKDFDITADMVD